MVILLKLKGLKRQSHKGGQSQESGGIPMVAGSTDEKFCPVFSLNGHKHTDTTSFGSSLGKKDIRQNQNQFNATCQHTE